MYKFDFQTWNNKQWQQMIKEHNAIVKPEFRLYSRDTMEAFVDKSCVDKSCTWNVAGSFGYILIDKIETLSGKNELIDLSLSDEYIAAHKNLS